MMSTNDWGSLFQLEIVDGKNDVENWHVEMNFELLWYCWLCVRRGLSIFLMA